MAEHKTSNVLAISLIAGLAGAGIALLLAPRSGKETRDKIHQKGDDLKRQANQNIEQAKLRMQHNTEKMRAWKEHMARKAQEKSQEAKDQLHDTMDSTQEEVNDFNASILKNWEEEV